MTAHTSAGSMSEEIIELIPALRAFARTFYQHQNDADDLVQETLVRALSNADHFQKGTRLKSWLFTIMRNTFCTRYRISKREAVGAADCISSQESVQPEQEWRMMGHEIEAACVKLPEKYRTAFEYIFIDGRSYEEAAVHFHCPIGTIKSRVNRARQQLISALY
ncbi:RNA polymerase subunit sigma [Rhizobium sp. R72]|uniref:sigma-70 family RNA polymerase sigma factor n=1 Tax=unclassified Rhizobium TaxID=2613769 RepID=UPI000B530CFF|nr:MULTISPECIES: sigma-70 family RNA polymerase sigma factor [unclassified Rhizobium]OWW00117.1 RNA polymerase subunit sigma [Rhizobium sp. R72]OWW00508.1 RNA polymerase subunit sigma [Rhizobium sp. R711]